MAISWRAILPASPRSKTVRRDFGLYRASLLRKIDLNALRVQGYAFQVALLYEAVVKGANVKEIPVEFVDRTQGESKLGLWDIVEFILNSGWIRLQRSRIFIKFCLVGTSGVAVNLVCFTLLLAQGINPYISSPIAIEVAILWNFLLNNFWTFRLRDTQEQVQIKAVKFNVISFLSLGISYSTFVLLMLAFPHLPTQVPQLVGIIPATLVNYFMNSYWTFRKSCSPQELEGGQKARNANTEVRVRTPAISEQNLNLMEP